MIVRSAREGGVEHAVEAEAAQRRGQRAGHVRARRQAELLGQGHRDRRRVLDDDVAFSGRRARPCTCLMWLCSRSAPVGQTMMHWPQLMQLRDVEALVEGRADTRLAAAADEVDGRDALDLLAHAHALAAEDALGRVAHDATGWTCPACSRSSRRRSGAGARPAPAASPCSSQLAVAHAVEAVVGMVGQQQLDDRLARAHGARRVRLDLHPLGDREGAARHQVALALDLHHAHAAGAGGQQALHVAEGRHAGSRAAAARQQDRRRRSALRSSRPLTSIVTVHHRFPSRPSSPRRTVQTVDAAAAARCTCLAMM